MSYATPTDLERRFDVRVLGDLVGDTGVRSNTAALLAHPNLQAALDDAAGEIDSAALVGQRYDDVELNALTGVGQAYLVRLNCDIAFLRLARRRALRPPIYEDIVKETDLALERLRIGERIFSSPADVAEGTAKINFPSAIAYQTIGLLRDRASRYFPIRREQQPSGD